MLIKLLKPLHGWRVFTGEIAIIVIGILIALAAQQFVEDWTWREKVRASERQLNREAMTNFRYATEAVTVGPCIDAQLVTLKRRLLASGSINEPAPLFRDSFSTFVFRQPSRPYNAAIWESLTADSTLPHFDDWRHILFAQLYTQIESLAVMGDQSDLYSGRLMVLAEAIPLDAGTRAALLQEIEEQRSRTRLTGVITIQVMASMRDLGNAPTAAMVQQYLDEQSGTVKFCRTHRLPLADWRKELALEPVHAPGTDD